MQIAQDFLSRASAENPAHSGLCKGFSTGAFGRKDKQDAQVIFEQFLSLDKKRYYAGHENRNDDDRQYVSHVGPQPGSNLHTFSGIGFFDKSVPSPPCTDRAEKNKNKRSQRQQEIADNQVLKVHDGAARAQRLYMGQNIESKRAGKSQKDHGNRADETRLLPAPGCQLHHTGYNIFKYRNTVYGA